MPQYQVTWTYQGHKDSEPATDYKQALEVVTDLLFTGKRGAVITIEVV